MNNTKYEVTVTTLSTYKADVPTHGDVVATRHAANAARRVHTDFAWPRLAEGVVASAQNKGEAAKVMKETWEALEAHCRDVAFGYKAGLALAGPVAQRHAAEMDLSPIALPTGESGTWTSVHTYQQLRDILRDEPGLVDRLRATGRGAAAKDALHAAWKEAPAFLRKEIVTRACDVRFASADQIAVVNRAKVKATAFKALNALDCNGRANQVLRGAERAIQQALKLAVQWADSEAFWETAPLPRQPAPERMDDESYAGEEDWAHSTPLKTHSVGGRTLGERWESRREIQELIAGDYGTAAEAAEELMDKLAAVLESAGLEVTWGFERLLDGSFLPIQSKEEMLDTMDARRAARSAQRSANDLGFGDVQDQVGLRDAVLAAFSEEEKKALEAMLGGVA